MNIYASKANIYFKKFEELEACELKCEDTV